MTTTEERVSRLAAEVKVFRAAEAELENARARRDASIVLAARAKVPQGEIASAVGVTRETIRTIVKAASELTTSQLEDVLSQAGV